MTVLQAQALGVLVQALIGLAVTFLLLHLRRDDLASLRRERTNGPATLHAKSEIRVELFLIVVFGCFLTIGTVITITTFPGLFPGALVSWMREHSSYIARHSFMTIMTVLLLKQLWKLVDSERLLDIFRKRAQ